jgi:hypothetical protein
MYPGTFDGKTIRCASCGDYDITGTVYDPGSFAKQDIETRQRALAQAKRFAAPGKRPMISSYET